jgi:hypothetical protein
MPGLPKQVPGLLVLARRIVSNGWIKLHRKVLNNEIFLKDPTAWHIFIYLLLTVDRHTGRTSESRNKMAKWLRVKTSTLYDAIDRLQKAEMVGTITGNKITQIYICNCGSFIKRTPEISPEQIPLLTGNPPEELLI